MGNKVIQREGVRRAANWREGIASIRARRLIRGSTSGSPGGLKRLPTIANQASVAAQLSYFTARAQSCFMVAT